MIYVWLSQEPTDNVQETIFAFREFIGQRGDRQIILVMNTKWVQKWAEEEFWQNKHKTTNSSQSLGPLVTSGGMKTFPQNKQENYLSPMPPCKETNVLCSHGGEGLWGFFSKACSEVLNSDQLPPWSSESDSREGTERGIISFMSPDFSQEKLNYPCFSP